MSSIVQLFGGLVLFVSLVLLWGWWMNGYFRRRGIKSVPAYIPYVGNLMNLLTQTEHLGELLMRLYNAYPDEKYIGMMRFHVPTVMVTDVDVLKQICIKDFDHFQDHHFNQNDDVLFGRSLLTLTGQKWRDMRATLSPTFTGSKMKHMIQLISEGGENMTASLLEQYQQQGKDLLEVELKDVYMRCVNDVIASTAFGFKVNSFIDTDNEFYRLAKSGADFSGLKFLILIIVPKITKALGLKSLSSETTDFFRNIILNSMKERKEQNIVKQDMLHLVMEARKGALTDDNDGNNNEEPYSNALPVGKSVRRREWTDDEIIPQLNIFIAGGLETSSNVASFTTHYLIVHPHMQRRLQKEIDDVVANLDGKITYDILNKMKYMDMLVNESLRLWPGAITTDRKCTKEYTLPPPNDNATEGYKMKVGDALMIPIQAFHRDPKNFEDPHTFDPERFSEENKHKIVPGSYLPFGIGPRNCIAMRYGLMMSKLAIFHLLWKFDLVPISKTKPDIKLAPKSVGLTRSHGYWVGLKPRLKNKI